MLEVTERLQVSPEERLCEPFTSLRTAGRRIAVGNAGAGHASVVVPPLRPDIVKLARLLISAAIDTDPAQRSLVTAVALLAHDLGATLTAEGGSRPRPSYPA